MVVLLLYANAHVVRILVSNLLLAIKASFIAQSHPPNHIDYYISITHQAKEILNALRTLFKCSNELSLNVRRTLFKCSANSYLYVLTNNLKMLSELFLNILRTVSKIILPK
mgnify:CR=1 FL=1